jgi:antitoxin component of MazEF toxin-antitoxin module
MFRNSQAMVIPAEEVVAAEVVVAEDVEEDAEEDAEVVVKLI